MAQLYSTGPVAVYVSTGVTMPGADPYTAGVPLFLGTAEAAPEIHVRPLFAPVNNDIGGALPFDYIFHGEEADIVVDLTRWNEGVYAACAARPNSQDGTRGRFTSTDIGSLMATEGLTYGLWLNFPYVSKAAYSVTMPAGYRFLSAFMIGPDTILPGTRANKRTCIFKAIRAFAPSDGTLRLYDHDMTGLPAVPPIGASGSTSSGS